MSSESTGVQHPGRILHGRSGEADQISEEIASWTHQQTNTHRRGSVHTHVRCRGNSKQLVSYHRVQEPKGHGASHIQSSDPTPSSGGSTGTVHGE